MDSRSTPNSADFIQTHPGLGVLRMATLFAESQTDPDDEALGLMSAQVEAGALGGAEPSEIWPELVRGIMCPAPSKMFGALRECGALFQVLPEVAAIFGVPQLSDEPAQVDLGEHMLQALDEAALRNAPLPVRFALLVMNIGKSDSPREHLPVHYKHIERGRPRVEALCARFEAPEDCKELALLALAECERVHRVSKMRAGPVAAMLERLGAFSTSEQFHQLMTVCACDFCAHPGRSGQSYQKSALLDIAFEACAEVDNAADDQTMARAEAIARAFRSLRWSDEPA
ncbi:tRNA nucleotidyltransferase [Methylocystis sp. MJC1]|jgi:tRNA nucleotidyltransferase (CCA-adding enzyme)|uniref:tRNA nucleotidyltransferase n=1 Tax=Methylocystis sp. MJC1 TaxID=2654282 RepID=UPI0013E9C77C|nr:tRNA nucleotidyltransferase [Methylocystis sp. MJC1]UZX10286.1 tRNA nucleotidyltransferase [Methylocystis sp. MJC1]